MWVPGMGLYCIYWFCGGHNSLLPLQEFTRCLRGVSTTLSFSQHLCTAFLDTLSDTCPIPRVLHGKTNSLAPPAALTPLTSPNTPLKNNYYSPNTVNPDESTLSSLLCSSLLLLHGQMTERPAGRKRQTAEHFSRGSSTQLFLIDSGKSSKAPLASSLQLSFPINYAIYPYRTFLSFPWSLLSSLQSQKMGKSE